MKIKIEKRENFKNNVSQGVKYLLSVSESEEKNPMYQWELTYVEMMDIAREIEKVDKLT